MSLINMPKIKLSRKSKIIIGIIITLTVLAVIVFGVWSAWNNMFRQNDRFYVVRVNVSSAEGQGKWHGKVKEVMPIVVKSKLSQAEADELDSTPSNSADLFNLFDINVRKLREELELVPEIDKVEVRRILPNTLDIKIVERIPLAFIAKQNSPLLVDKDGVVIRRSHCIDISGLLPVLRKYKTKAPQAGEIFEEAKAALEYIELTQRVSDYAVLRIADIDLSKDDYLTMLIYYGGDRRDWYYIIDVPRMNPAEGLDRILSAIETSRKEGSNRRYIVLRYNGQAVLKAPAGGAK